MALCGLGEDAVGCAAGGAARPPGRMHFDATLGPLKIASDSRGELVRCPMKLEGTMLRLRDVEGALE